MRTLSKNLSLLAIATAALVGSAFAAEAGKEVTLKGTQQCAKCSLKEEGVKGCQDVLTVKDGTTETKYYIAKSDIQKAAHVCAGKKENVSVTGTVEEKDGKKILTASKIEGGEKADKAHDHAH